MANGSITIRVDKKQLLEALEKNKAAHGAAYEKAKAGYLKVTRQSLEDMLQRIVGGELLPRLWLDTPPDDHTGDYDDVIAMMQWSLDNTIELTQAQFKQYIQDDWGWKDAWTTSNATYLQA